jgi:hypothetical protein
VTDLVLTDEIGAGGFGKVWRGTWKKVTAAVKVRAGRGGAGAPEVAFARTRPLRGYAALRSSLCLNPPRPRSCRAAPRSRTR